jgi:uncharacterized protein DUF6572
MSAPNQPIAGNPHDAPFSAKRGVEHAGVIDVLAHDARTGEVTLGMVEPRAWDGSEERLFELQEKINAYLSFALDGEMKEAFPALVDKPLRLELMCAAQPDAVTFRFLGLIRDQIAFQGIKLDVRVGPIPAGQG